MFVDILTKPQDMKQRGEVDDTKVTDMKQRGPVDNAAFTDMKQRGEVDNTKVTTLEETPSLLSPSGRLSREELRKKGVETLSEINEPISLLKVLGMDKESAKKRAIKKTENFINGESMLLPFTFSRWLRETKEIQSSKINKEDKIKYAKEFLEFLNQ
jgi:hypothetical protein